MGGVGTTRSRDVCFSTGVGGPRETHTFPAHPWCAAPSTAGDRRVTPAGQDPGVATQEFTRGQSISNLVAVKLVNGKIQVKVSAGSARTLMDIAGYYSALP